MTPPNNASTTPLAQRQSANVNNLRLVLNRLVLNPLVLNRLVLSPACLALAFFLMAATTAPAQTIFKSLVDFSGSNGAGPQFMSLVQGRDGDLYGTTDGGGAFDDGTIFDMTTAGKLTTIHSFCEQPECADGGGAVSGLAQAPDGNFYGTTRDGGAYILGSVYKISPAGKFTSLHSFAGGVGDGSLPYSRLLYYNGNFYGTTVNGGMNSSGTVYKITPHGALTVLYNFCAVNGQSPCADGQQPYAGLIAYGGNFYGATTGGGSNFQGTVYELTPQGILTTLHSFSYTDGAAPGSALFAVDGTFYGTTSHGGTYGGGTIYQITPAGQFSTLYNFCALTNCSDGSNSVAELIQGTNGNLYGATQSGGIFGYGTVFEITTSGTLTTLHSFDVSDGSYPVGALLQARNGDFYGTTAGGGTKLNGTVYRLSGK